MNPRKLLLFSLLAVGIIAQGAFCFLVQPYITAIITIFNAIFLYLTYKFARDENRQINQLSKAILHGSDEDFSDDYGGTGLGNDLREIHLKVKEIIDFVKSPNPDLADFEHISADEYIGRNLSELAEQKRRQLEEEEKRDWRNQGLAQFGEILRTNDKDLESISENVINALVKYLDASQGAFFIAYDEEEGRYLKATGSYAYQLNRLDAKIQMGQGLVGQVMQDKELLYIENVPDDYVEMSSGLGHAHPTNLVIVPLCVNDVFYGALEIASFKKIETYKREFLGALSENIASAIATVKNGDETKRLLQLAEERTAELKSKEEEMRQNVETLQSTQEEMARKEVELSGLFNALNESMGVAEISSSGELLQVNNRLEGILSLEYDAIDSKRLFPSGRHEDIWQSLKDKNTTSADFEMNTQGGSKWLNVNYSPIVSKNGEFVKALLIIQDITVKKSREQEFERLSLVANNTDNSVIITGADGRVNYVNEGFIRMTGFTLEDMQGKKPGSVLQGKETNPATIKKIRAALRKGEPIYAEILNYRKDKSSYWISLTINPVKDDQGEIVGYIAIQADITETKKASLDYRYKLEAISRSNAIIEFTTDGTIVDANDNFLSIFKYEKDEIIGKHHSIFVTEEERKSAEYESLWNDLANGKFVNDEFLRIDKDGSQKYLRGIYNPIYDINGNPIKIIKFAVDITNEKKLQLETEQQQHELTSQLETINKTIATLEFDREGNIESANGIYLDVAGYDNEKELLGKNYESLLTEEELKKPQNEMMWQGLKSGNHFSGQFSQKSKNGEILWLLGTFNPVMDKDGNLDCIKMYGQFNTLQVAKEQEMRRTLDFFNHSIPYIEFSPEGKCKKANETFHERWSLSKLRIRKLFMHDVFNKDFDEEQMKQTLDKLSQNESIERDVYHSNDEGEVLAYQAIFHPVFDEDDKLEKVSTLLLIKDKVNEVNA